MGVGVGVGVGLGLGLGEGVGVGVGVGLGVGVGVGEGSSGGGVGLIVGVAVGTRATTSEGLVAMAMVRAIAPTDNAKALFMPAPSTGGSAAARIVGKRLRRLRLSGLGDFALLTVAGLALVRAARCV